MKLILTNHAKERLNQYRQKGINKQDIFNTLYKYKKSKIPFETIIRGKAKSGRRFHVVAVDNEDGRKIITIVGH